MVKLLQGCREDHGDFKKDQPEWVAFTSRDYGYSKMTVHNATHLSFQQISADQVSAGCPSRGYIWLVLLIVTG